MIWTTTQTIISPILTKILETILDETFRENESDNIVREMEHENDIASLKRSAQRVDITEKIKSVASELYKKEERKDDIPNFENHLKRYISISKQMFLC